MVVDCYVDCYCLQFWCWCVVCYVVFGYYRLLRVVLGVDVVVLVCFRLLLCLDFVVYFGCCCLFMIAWCCA